VYVRWLRRALENLEEEFAFAARDDPVAAERLVERIASNVARLEKHPALGRPGRLPNTRELIIAGTSYIVPYRVRGQAIEILRVFHGRRKWPRNL
jgi:toxin ParE1/3/4